MRNSVSTTFAMPSGKDITTQFYVGDSRVKHCYPRCQRPLRRSRRRVDVHTAGYLVCSDFPATDGGSMVWEGQGGRRQFTNSFVGGAYARHPSAASLMGCLPSLPSLKHGVFQRALRMRGCGVFFRGVGVGVKDELDVNGGSYASDVNVRGHGKKEFYNFRGLAEILFPTSPGLFKLEDVAMGIWIEKFKESGHAVKSISDDRFYNAGCDLDYILAHYQSPKKVLCLRETLLKEQQPICCE
ncbi:hypothetical protein Cgig2_003180 [Carnegiea gigantea]|uniref:Hexosyltransferase n=1 Tax=Carnegiea gigantea TaxID=171969 RepID=A0A9Q1K2W3_9CARY|nr:hypothetical protein Cgig2_003180 [Carnegiea gigantea]